MTLRKIILMLAIMIGLIGCESSDKALEDLQGQTELTTRATIQEENNNLAARAAVMERDLATRHNYFQALKGRYEGEFETEQGRFRIRITLAPSIAPYRGSGHRIHRMPEEIVAELNGLHLNVNVVLWSPSAPHGTVSCTVERIRPDMRSGLINIVSENCKAVYVIAPSKEELDFDIARDESADLVRDILDGAVERVNYLSGEIQPGNANIFRFNARK